LDDGFDSPQAHSALVAAGFQVKRFQDHFKDAKGKRKQNVPDPEIIRLCSDNQWLLITLDRDMEFAHTEEIRRSDVAILAMTSNNQPIAVWISAIVKARAKIERDFKKRQRPYFSRISPEGTITKSQTITEDYKPPRRPTRKTSAT
jgi:predicted nuclease of predicted toxin-antitoxin system